MNLSHFEELAERLIEGSLTRLFLGQLHPRAIAVQLARALEDAASAHKTTPLAEEEKAVPSAYLVKLHPEDYADIAERCAEIEATLADHVLELARQGGLILVGMPRVTLQPDVSVPRLSAVVQADPSDVDRRFHTQAFERRELAPEPPPRPAWLVVEGRRNVPLTQPLITLGRRLDNDIILDDPRVSRQHAQLRYRYGHYVLYDLGSSGGTRVNGVPVQECLLQSGDVISLAGVELIYIEDEEPAQHPSTGQDTTPGPPIPGQSGHDRPCPDEDV